ncbi:MAG: holo-ACP synthase [Acidobacteria bacterium]|nr:holo-ACP synthase [Acidobacteriota bacterium]
MTEIGTDLVDVDRFRRVLQRRPGLAGRLFTEDERSYAATANDPTERLAVRFAAKEAVMKALGCGIGAVRMVDIEVVRGDDGNPSLLLHGSAASLAAERGLVSFKLSMTHTDTVAHAMVVAE